MEGGWRDGGERGAARAGQGQACLRLADSAGKGAAGGSCYPGQATGRPAKAGWRAPMHTSGIHCRQAEWHHRPRMLVGLSAPPATGHTQHCTGRGGTAGERHTGSRTGRGGQAPCMHIRLLQALLHPADLRYHPRYGRVARTDASFRSSCRQPSGGPPDTTDLRRRLAILSQLAGAAEPHFIRAGELHDAVAALGGNKRQRWVRAGDAQHQLIEACWGVFGCELVPDLLGLLAASKRASQEQRSTAGATDTCTQDSWSPVPGPARRWAAGR